MGKEFQCAVHEASPKRKGISRMSPRLIFLKTFDSQPKISHHFPISTITALFLSGTLVRVDAQGLIWEEEGKMPNHQVRNSMREAISQPRMTRLCKHEH